jgi:LCP family protein required for cell wall assembly
VTVLIVATAAGVVQAIGVATAWSSIDRLPVTTDSTTTTTAGSPNASGATNTSPPPSVVAFVGSDSREGLDDLDDFGTFDGQRADVIMLAIRREADIGLLSIPRDLYVEDTCDGGRHRIADAFQGCDDRNGLASLVADLETLTGLNIDHAVAVDLAGFQEVVDAIGGYEICTDHALRDEESGLNLDTGCTVADGETTLQWLRSRQTERQVDGTWEVVPGVSDLERNERQRQFLIDMLHRQSARSGPTAILATLRSVAPYLTIDETLSLSDAVGWVWDFRTSEVRTAELPVTADTTSGGAYVLTPTVDVPDFVSGIPA